MPTLTVQVKPEPSDVVHVTATVETRDKKAEPIERKLIVHEGSTVDTFDVVLNKDERLVIETEIKEKIVHDAAQGSVTRVPIEVEKAPPPLKPSPKPVPPPSA